MKKFALVALRLTLALLGAIALYLVVYGSTAWLADVAGYETALGRGLGLVNGALNPLAFGAVAVLFFAIALFWILSRFAFTNRSGAQVEN
jgi:hypothetical protein